MAYKVYATYSVEAGFVTSQTRACDLKKTIADHIIEERPYTETQDKRNNPPCTLTSGSL